MIPFPNKKYQLIYADVPWQYDDKANAGERGVDYKYDTMSVEEIKSLPIQDIAADDCVLFFWGTWPHVFDCEPIINSWGFEYKTCAFVWYKLNSITNTSFIGMGNWTRSNSEFVLLATKGNPKRINAGISQIIKSVVRSHSRKPDIIADRIVQLCGDVPRIELFARIRRADWDVWGNDPKLESKPLELF